MIENLFCGIVGFLVGVNVAMYESRTSSAWAWLVAKVKSLRPGKGKN